MSIIIYATEDEAQAVKHPDFKRRKIYIDRFLETMIIEKRAAKSTLSAYEADLKDFFGFLKDKNPVAVLSQDIQDYIGTQKKFLASTVARRLSSLRQFYKFLMHEGEVQKNPISFITSPPYRGKTPSPLKDEKIKHLLEEVKIWEGAEGTRLSVLLELFYITDLSVNELVSLPFTAVIRNQPWLLIQGKEIRDQIVPLTPKALEALSEYIKVRPSFFVKKKDSPWLFPSTGQKGHLTRQRFGQLLKELTLKRDLNPKQ